MKENHYPVLDELRRVFGEEATMLNLNAVAKYLHKSPRTLLKDKTFPVKKIGGRYEVYIVNLARWIA